MNQIEIIKTSGNIWRYTLFLNGYTYSYYLFYFTARIAAWRLRNKDLSTKTVYKNF